MSSYEIDLRWMPRKTFDDKSTLVQIMVLCHQTPSHYLHQFWPRSMSPYDVIQPQLVTCFKERWKCLCILYHHPPWGGTSKATEVTVIDIGSFASHLLYLIMVGCVTAIPFSSAQHNKVWCHYNVVTVQFFPESSWQTLHSSLMRASYGFLLWVQILIYVLSQSLQCCMLYHVILDDGLTHWGRDKWPPFSRRHFQMHFLE